MLVMRLRLYFSDGIEFVLEVEVVLAINDVRLHAHTAVGPPSLSSSHLVLRAVRRKPYEA